MDNWINNLPGSPRLKVGFTVALLVGGLAIPVFTKGSGKQGHDYFSQEQPEAIQAGREQLRRRLAEEHQQQQQQLEQQQKKK
jgi:hypothetical protein